jgi:hypothetical protein
VLSNKKTAAFLYFENEIQIFNVETGDTLRLLEGHAYNLSVKKLSNDRLIIGSEDKTIKL